MKMKLVAGLFFAISFLSTVTQQERNIICYYYTTLKHPTVVSHMAAFKETQAQCFIREAGYIQGSYEYNEIYDKLDTFYKSLANEAEMQLILMADDTTYPLVAFLKVVDEGKTAQLFQASCANDQLYKMLLLKIFYYTGAQRIQFQIHKDRVRSFQMLRNLLSPTEIDPFYGDPENYVGFELSRFRVMAVFHDLIKFF